jgi:hypothetical protein
VTARDCPYPDDDRCVDGICLLPDRRPRAAECRAAPKCLQDGRCDADFEKSFLGQSRKIECVASSVEDCTRSEDCRTFGNCAPFDGWCRSSSDEHCLRSERCEHADECVFSAAQHLCLASERLCRPRSGPEWASVGDVNAPEIAKVFAEASGAPPGERRLLLCRADFGSFNELKVTFGDSCADFGFRDNRGRAWFVLPGVTTDAPLRAAFADRGWFHSGSPGFVRARPGSDGGYRGAYHDAELECRALPQKDAERASTRWLRDVDRLLASAEKERPRAREFAASPGLAKARPILARAGAWLGWDDAAIVERLGKLDALSLRWNHWLTDEFDHAYPVAKDRTRIDDNIDVRVTARICGEALKARVPNARASCAFEVSVHRRGTRTLLLNFSDGLNFDAVLGSDHEVRVEPMHELSVTPSRMLTSEHDAVLLVEAHQETNQRLLIGVRLGNAPRQLLRPPE